MHTFVANCTYRFHNFLALNSTHIISEVLNLTSTFVLMLIVIILSFINSGDMVEACSVHVRMSISHICIHLWQMVQISQLFGPQFYTHHLRSSKFDQYLCFDVNSHNPELH